MEIVQILKALGDENRIRILNVLKEGELCVCEIEHILEMTQSNVSRHLNKLSGLKIVICGKKAQWVRYRINENILKEYSFVEMLLETELNKIELCRKDLEKLKCYKASGMSCERLKECAAMLKNMDFNAGEH